MLLDLNASPSIASPVKAEVAVIGGGLAGLLLANRLAERSIRTVVVEAGGVAGNGLPDPFLNAECNGILYRGAAAGRARCLGGTSTIWGGALPARSLDDPGQPQRELAGRRHEAWIDDAEHALARKHIAGADQPRDVGRRRDHRRQPECSATIPPERLSHFTREKPAARIISAKAGGFGNLRIDSTRY